MDASQLQQLHHRMLRLEMRVNQLSKHLDLHADAIGAANDMIVSSHAGQLEYDDRLLAYVESMEQLFWLVVSDEATEH